MPMMRVNGTNLTAYIGIRATSMSCLCDTMTQHSRTDVSPLGMSLFEGEG